MPKGKIESKNQHDGEHWNVNEAKKPLKSGASGRYVTA